MNPFTLPAAAVIRDLEHLRYAIDLAKQARADGNRPFGAVLVGSAGGIIATAKNIAITESDPTGHAEINVVRAACALRLPGGLADSTMYTSTEPCLMCAGAIYIAGIGRVVYALASADLAATPGSSVVRTVPISLRDALAPGRGRPIIEHMPTGTEREPHDDFWTDGR
jgi:tRNA(Arg) A34 adenosine deaminase TadA